MRVRPEAFPAAAPGGISTAALLLAFCCAPALASTGVEDIAIVVDPGTASSVVAIELNPRVASILREIFEETVPGGQAVEHATPASLPSAAPLARVIAPDLLEQGRDVDEAGIDESESDLTRIETKVSGASEDELSRFRRQMFRTDI
ncbi:MAG: hypothetical protein ACE1Y4_00730 [Lysobacterales bacterium]|nr:hypothetical protein [Pseudomonadota bacterium]